MARYARARRKRYRPTSWRKTFRNYDKKDASADIKRLAVVGVVIWFFTRK